MTYGWFDFATSRPSLDSLIKSVQGEGGGAAPATTNVPTTSEVRSAKANAVGGAPKRCRKGKNCSATCIDSREYCLVDFPVPVSESLTHVRDFVENRLKNRVAAGAMTQEQADKYIGRLEEKDNFGAARAKELYKGLQKLQEEHTKDGKFDKEGHRKALDHVLDTIVLGSFTPRDKKAPLTVEEIEGLHANRETWTKLAKLQREVADRGKKGDDMSPQELQTKLRPIVDPKRQSVTDAESEIARALLPKSERDYWKKAGALDKKDTAGRFGANPSHDALPTSHGRLDKQTGEEANNRLDLMAKMYLAHGGRDIATGQRVPITHSDLEHNIAEAHAKRAAEQGLNYSPLKTALNVGRGNKDHEEYFNSVLSRYNFDKNGKLTPESRAKVASTIEKAGDAASLKGSIVSKAAAAKTAGDLKSLISTIEAQPSDTIKAKLYNKLASSFLTAFGGKTVSETARAGLQSHLRAEQAHYWYGDKMPGGGAAARSIVNKAVSLMERGDSEKLNKLVSIMQGASGFIKSYVNNTVAPDPKVLVEGKPALAMGGDKTREIKQAVIDARDQIIKQIEAL
jgi:hypothetical protein